MKITLKIKVFKINKLIEKTYFDLNMDMYL